MGILIYFLIAKRRRVAKADEEESNGSNEYDLEDSFIDNSESEEESDADDLDEDYQPEPEKIDQKLLKEEEWKEKQDDAPEVLELLKEARDYLRNKKLQK